MNKEQYFIDNLCNTVDSLEYQIEILKKQIALMHEENLCAHSMKIELLTLLSTMDHNEWSEGAARSAREFDSAGFKLNNFMERNSESCEWHKPEENLELFPGTREALDKL